MITLATIAVPSTAAALVTGVAVSGKVRLQTLLIAALFAITLVIFVPDARAAYLVWSSAMVVLLAALSVFDAETLTVPDALTVPLIVIGMLHAAFNIPDPGAFLIAPVAVVAAGWTVGRLAGGARFSWFGGGDILLIAGALAWLGPYVFANYLLLTGILVFTFAAVQIMFGRKRPHFALAPASSLAQIAIWFGGPVL